jgi:hypothetical protein
MQDQQGLISQCREISVLQTCNRPHLTICALEKALHTASAAANQECSYARAGVRTDQMGTAVRLVRLVRLVRTRGRELVNWQTGQSRKKRSCHSYAGQLTSPSSGSYLRNQDSLFAPSHRVMTWPLSHILVLRAIRASVHISRPCTSLCSAPFVHISRLCTSCTPLMPFHTILTCADQG